VNRRARPRSLGGHRHRYGRRRPRLSSPGAGGRAPGELGLEPVALYRAKATLTRGRSLAWRLRTGGRLDTGGLRVLFYHRLSDERDELAVSPRRFVEQMSWLAAEGYRGVDAVTAAELLDAPTAPGRVVGLCFDDGYREVAEHAVPVLERLGFGASVFVATGVVDGSARFGWYARQPPVLSWAEIDALRDSPLRFGAHTITHPSLIALPEADARREIAGSKAALEARLGEPVKAFCYPAGLFGARERRLVAEAGFSVATSCEPGVNGPGTDRLALRRIQVGPRDSLLDVRAKVGGGHDAPGRLRAAYRRLRHGARPPGPL
jgi:peptidoglycan/xylan/chitin deacetylase (PgdA/CDA1 family)